MSDTIKSLPVFQTAGEAYKYTIKNIALLIRVSWLWLALAYGFGWVMVLFVGEWRLIGNPTPLTESQIAAQVAYSLLQTFAWYAIAVLWHRALLLGEQPGWVNFNLGMREVRYFFYGTTIWVISVALIAVGTVLILSSGVSAGEQGISGIAIVGVLAALVGSIVMLPLFGRLFLVLPGSAVGDRRISIQESFELTSGNSWRITGGIILSILPTILPAFLASQNPDAAIKMITNAGWVMNFIGFAFNTVAGFVLLSYMSYCYWFFVPPPGQDDLT